VSNHRDVAKRREKERLTVDLSDMGAILRTVIQDQPLSQDKKDGDPVASSTPDTKKGTSESKDERGMIGESTRAKPLTKQQKKQALYVTFCLLDSILCSLIGTCL
jgi:hypothetical protein